MSYTELQVTSNFTFLRGASHPEELVEQAFAYGHSAIALTDRNTLAGIVRAHSAAKKIGIRFIPACRLDLLDGPSLLAYPTDRAAYARLSGLLTLGNRRAEKGQCHLNKIDVFAQSEGLKFVILPPDRLNNLFDYEAAFQQAVAEYREVFGENAYLAACRTYRGDDAKQFFRLDELSRHLKIPLVSTNDIHYHHPDRRQLQDVLTCIREKCTIQQAGYRLHPNAERYMKGTEEMRRLFRQYPDAIRRTQEISEACHFSLDELEYIYPKEVTTEGRSPDEEMRHLVYLGLKERLGDVIPEKVEAQIEYELAFIKRKNISEYFITVEDICRFARNQRILYQGRGSAANCACCYYLGITNVDPSKFDLFFERFLSDARDEPPDIDVDFEHERREEVIQYIFNKYGRDRAAIVATVTQVHQKGAVRDVGKAMGLSEDAVDQLSKSIAEFSPQWFEQQRASLPGLDPRAQILMKVLELTGQYMGFPRQLGQHTGGFVITEGKLSDLCPIFNARMENRTNIEWNKDDIDALGFLKIDVLALGMLTAIRKCFDLVEQYDGRQLTLANIPQDDPKVYEMITAADTIGVFQIESRAQMSMLPRMRPTCFYDLVIEVAIVRPGPIQGGMVHPYLRRRNNEEPVEFPSKEMEEILGRTLGVPLFQEQAMKIAVVAGGFTPAEADEFRRSMATFKVTGGVHRFRDKLIAGMIKNGFVEEYAHRVFQQLEGFGSYGFPESHAASFAHLVYISAWNKYYYPDAFAVTILNSLPMGFYAAAQLIRDAIQHGVIVRALDVNYSFWDYVLEEKLEKYHAVRMGFRQIEGIREEEMLLLIACRVMPYTTLQSLQDVGLSLSTLEKLADADAFGSMGLNRREALWQVTGLAKAAIARERDKEGKLRLTRQLDLFSNLPSQHGIEEGVSLPKMADSEEVVEDYATKSLSLKAHPVSFLRENLRQLRALPGKELGTRRNGEFVKVAGLILVRQRPGTAKGVCFITLEDEDATINLIVWPDLFDQYRKEILSSKLLMVAGNLQIEKGIVHVIVQRCYNLNPLLAHLTPSQEQDLPLLTLSRADENSGLITPGAPKQAEIEATKRAAFLPEGRNFK